MLDYIFLTYFLWQIFKGYSNGVGKEVKRLFFTLLFLCGVLGIYILSDLTGLIKTTIQTALNSTGFWISFGSLVTAVFLFFFIRRKVTDYAEQQFNGKVIHYIGSLAAALRSIVVIYLVVIFMNLVPFGLFSESLRQSIIASPLTELFELYKQPEQHHSNEPFEFYDY